MTLKHTDSQVDIFPQNRQQGYEIVLLKQASLSISQKMLSCTMWIVSGMGTRLRHTDSQVAILPR